MVEIERDPVSVIYSQTGLSVSPDSDNFSLNNPLGLNLIFWIEALVFKMNRCIFNRFYSCA